MKSDAFLRRSLGASLLCYPCCGAISAASQLFLFALKSIGKNYGARRWGGMGIGTRIRRSAALRYGWRRGVWGEKAGAGSITRSRRPRRLWCPLGDSNSHARFRATAPEAAVSANSTKRAMVPPERLELSRLPAADFESAASAGSAIGACRAMRMAYCTADAAPICRHRRMHTPSPQS